MARRRVIEETRGRAEHRKGRQLPGGFDLLIGAEDLVQSDETVDRGQFFGEFVARALHQASRSDDLPVRLGFLPGLGTEKRLDGFFPGAIDERASIDDQRVGLLRVVDEPVAAGLETAEDQLTVNLVLGTAQADQRDALRFALAHG